MTPYSHKKNWKTYDCASYVAAMDGCPDPAVVRPQPDDDYVCAGPVDADTIAAIREEFCKFKFGSVVDCVDPQD